MNGNAAEHDLITAGTFDEALNHVAAGWRPIAGGTDLMVLLEAGRLPYRRLVSVRGLAELRNIEVTDSHIAIGAAVTYSEIRAHPVLQRELALLCCAAGWTGGIANQNRGTLGGNIVNASPAADSLPALLAYDAEVELISSRGPRWVAYDVFHTGYKTMRMEPDELLKRIRCPRPRDARIEYTRKVGARKAQAVSKIGIAAVASMDGGRPAHVRIALASVAPIPLRCRETERVLTGVVLSDETRKRAREVLAREVAPIDDIRSTREYRRHVAANLLSEFMDLLRLPGRLANWNQLDAASAGEQIGKCCASARWAAQLTAQRPFSSEEQLFDAADRVWASLDPEDHLEAFRSHPRIGDSASPSQPWAVSEQSGMSLAGEQLREAMAAANRAYESRFGFTYIVRATGRSAQEMLDLLHRRLANAPDAELKEAGEQQRQITQLRLRRWLSE